MKNEAKAYNGLEQFSKSHRILIRVYIAYLFLIPGISMFFHDQYFENSPKWTLFTFLIITVIHLGFLINNFHAPATSLGTLFLIIRIPLEVLIFSFFQDWSFETVLASLYSFEIIGFAFGLTTGTIFRKANITFLHRLASFVLACGITYCALMRFSGLTDVIFMPGESIWIPLVMILIGIITATIPYTKIFVGGQDGNGLNMGTSTLMTRLGKYLALAMVINLVLMILGINL